MTSVGDESEPPDGTERFKDKGVKDKIEDDLTVAGADEDDGEPVGNSRSFLDRICLILNNPFK
jgi:hypothetical protein